MDCHAPLKYTLSERNVSIGALTVGTKQCTVRKQRKLRGLAFIYDNGTGNEGLMLAVKEFHLVAEEGGRHCCEHVNHLCSQLKIYSTPTVFAWDMAGKKTPENCCFYSKVMYLVI